jgi:hypothetical protein
MPWVNRMLHGYKVVIDPAEEALASSSAVRSAPKWADVDARPGNARGRARHDLSTRMIAACHAQGDAALAMTAGCGTQGRV